MENLKPSAGNTGNSMGNFSPLWVSTPN